MPDTCGQDGACSSPPNSLLHSGSSSACPQRSKSPGPAQQLPRGFISEMFTNTTTHKERAPKYKFALGATFHKEALRLAPAGMITRVQGTLVPLQPMGLLTGFNGSESWPQKCQ